MTTWRRFVGLAFLGTGLIAGCSVTVGPGNSDGGTFDETGGTSSTGGTTSTGGTGNTTGGTTAVATTVLACDPTTEQPNTCGECLQTADADLGMCTDYLACANVAGCMPIIQVMVSCMVGKADATTGELLPDPETADTDCRSQAGIAKSGETAATTAAAAATTLWNAIQGGFQCSESCYAI